MQKKVQNVQNNVKVCSILTYICKDKEKVSKKLTVFLFLQGIVISGGQA